MSRTTTFRKLACAAAAAGALAASSFALTAPARADAPDEPQEPSRCMGEDLFVTVKEAEGGDGMGQTSRLITAENVGSEACALAYAPTVGTTDPYGDVVGSMSTPAPENEGIPQIIEPGESAYAVLVASNPENHDCERVETFGYRIIQEATADMPPDFVVHVSSDMSPSACSDPEVGLLTVQDWSTEWDNAPATVPAGPR